MVALNENEFKAIKQTLKKYSPRQTAHMMKRSTASVFRVKASKDFTEYKLLAKTTHQAKHPRIPLWKQLRDARIEELNALLDQRFIQRKTIINRIIELRS